MLLVIPLGYFVAVFLLVCGVLNCVEYVQNLQQGIDRATMLSGITTTAWPIISAVVILLLIQVCKQLESLRLAATCPTEESNKKTGKSKKQKHSRGAEGYGGGLEITCVLRKSAICRTLEGDHQTGSQSQDHADVIHL